MERHQHARDLIAQLCRVALAAHVDRHEGDQVLFEFLAPIDEQSPKCPARRGHHEIGDRRSVALRRSLRVGQGHARPVVHLLDIGATFNDVRRASKIEGWSGVARPLPRTSATRDTARTIDARRTTHDETASNNAPGRREAAAVRRAPKRRRVETVAASPRFDLGGRGRTSGEISKRLAKVSAPETPSANE